MPSVEATASWASAGSLSASVASALTTLAPLPLPLRLVGVRDYALASQEREDARAGDLQHVGDIVVGQEGQRMEAELAVRVLEPPSRPIEWKCGSGNHSTRCTLPAPAAVDAALAQAAAVPAEHRVDEGVADRAEQPGVVGEPRPELERQGEHPLPERHARRQNVFHKVRSAGRHAAAQA